MLDELSAARDGDDGLPISLPAVIERYGMRVFKIKLGGDPAADAARLSDVLGVLDARAPGHRYTLDGNEQYARRRVAAPTSWRACACCRPTLPALKRCSTSSSRCRAKRR